MASARDPQQLVDLLPQIERLAASVRRKCPRSIDVADLVQVGAEACWKALPRFDPSRGVQLWTWLLPRCRGGMLDYLRGRYMLGGGQRKGRKERGVSIHARRPDGTPLFECLDPHASEVMRRQAASESFQDLLRSCNRTERIVLTLSFQEDQNLKVIGESIGLSESRISQLLANCLARLAPLVAARMGLPPAKAAGCDAVTEVAARSAPGGSQPDRLPRQQKRCQAGCLASL